MSTIYFAADKPVTSDTTNAPVNFRTQRGCKCCATGTCTGYGPSRPGLSGQTCEDWARLPENAVIS